MAPALTSANSFVLTTTPHTRLRLNTQRLTTTTVFANKKNGSFGLSKSADGEAEDGNNSVRFSFNLSKLPDVKSLIPATVNTPSALSFGNQRRKDPGTVFIAGATGQSGIRIAQTLLRQGFSVRAGVSDLAAAQELACLAAKYKIISKDESKRLNAVESTFEDLEAIAKAIGNASKVVVTIGPSEDGPTGEVTTLEALRVIQAAQLANVGHVAVVYDGSASSSTYNVLDGISSFFNNLFSRTQPLTLAEFLQNIIETNLSYTLIKTKLTEDFSPESSYRVVVSPEGSSGPDEYKVAKSQIALLVADIFSNTAVAENKVVEVYTDPSAPPRTIDELFSAIPEDERRKNYLESVEKAKAEEAARAASEKAREATESAKKLQQEASRLKQRQVQAASVAEEAQGTAAAAAAGTSVESLLDKAKGMSSGLSWDKFSSQLKSAVEKVSEEPKVRLATVRGQAKAQSLPAQKAVVKNTSPKPPPVKPKAAPKPTPKQTEAKAEVRKVFGGLFKQETIYVDDD